MKNVLYQSLQQRNYILQPWRWRN